MPEFIPRSLLILTAVVALIALFIGVRDYLAPKHEPRPAVTVSVPSALQRNAASARKKSSTAKRHAQISASEPDAGAAADSAKNLTAEPVIRDVLAKAESAPKRGKTVEDHPMLNEVSSRSSSRSCAPLPNSTKPEDVDAIYYQGWAREYGCGAD